MIETNEKQLSISPGKRVLYLTKDLSLIARQLAGENFRGFEPEALLDHVSTDAYPTRACFRFDRDYMAKNALTGLALGEGKTVPENAVQQGSFGVLVAGSSFGMGSSREHFPLSLQAAGIETVFARSIERICAQNMQNIGLPYTENRFELLKVLLSGPVTMAEITQGLDPVSSRIVREGGIFNFYRNLKGDLPKPQTNKRPMTAGEKILAKAMGVDYVKPGDLGFVEADGRYSYEIFLPMSWEVLQQQVANPEIADKDSVYLFYDHSVLDPSPDAFKLASNMRKIAKEKKLLLYDGNRTKGAEGICHTIMMDNHVLPGQIIFGTDSHTCTLGALNTMAIGIGATEWAFSLWTKKTRVVVPETVRFDFNGAMQAGIMAKDVMLYLLSQPLIKGGGAIGKIAEYGGLALQNMRFDEQVVFPNMSIEGGFFTGIVEPNPQMKAFVRERTGLTLAQIRRLLSYSDSDASYNERVQLDLSSIKDPYVALPGNPRNGVPLPEVAGTKIQKAYIGSCTGGKYADIKAAAEVLDGRRVHPTVKLHIQTASREVYEQVVKNGLIQVILESGAILVPPGCGACVNFGPGALSEGETGIFDTNRNLAGRTGHKNSSTYLANPSVTAASAVAGEITSPLNL